jgi:predicted glycosyltransferase
MKILIDMSNSPHVLFFRPIIKELEKRGHEVVITAREHAQTKQLLDLYWFEYKIIGKHAGRSIFKKLLNAVSRIFELSRYVSRENPDVFLSHQSPYVIYTAFLNGKKSVYLFDNDQAKLQNYLTFPLATKVMYPESLFYKSKKFVAYPGIKESVYLSSWPDDERGLEKIKKIKKKKILIRTEISSSAYHAGNSLADVIKKLASKYQIIISPRNEDQKKEYGKIKGVILLDKPVDGPTLIKNVDIVMGGGGTMNREAAVLGKPVISLYSGKLLASDIFLLKKGLTIHDQNPSFDLIEKTINKKSKKMDFADLGKEAVKKIVSEIEKTNR